MTKDTAAVYAALLVDLDYEQLMAAVQWLALNADTKGFLPTIAAIRAAAARTTQGARVPAFDEALTEVQSEIRRVGSYGVPRFSHPAIAALVSAYGWQNLCMSEEWEVTLGHLRRLYETVSVRAQEEAVALPDGTAQRFSALVAKMRALPG